MNQREFLIRQAEVHWTKGEEVPYPSLMTMLNAGINVDYERRMFNLTTQDSL